MKTFLNLACCFYKHRAINVLKVEAKMSILGSKHRDTYLDFCSEARNLSLLLEELPKSYRGNWVAIFL